MWSLFPKKRRRDIFANVLPEAPITREVRDSICRARVREIAGEAIRTDPRYSFVRAMQRRLVQQSRMSPSIAWNIAARNLREFLADEGVAFGDPRYDWSDAGARTLIEEREISYWDHRP